MNKYNIKTKELFENVPSYLKPYFDAAEYPWEILPKIKEIAAKLLQEGLEGYTLLEEGVLVGRNVKIAKTAMKRYNFSLADIVDEETGEILAQLTSVS